MKRIDLHVHSTSSDGSYSPEALVDLAKEQGLSAIAITDHDTVSGFAPAYEYGKLMGIEVVPGIEISTKYGGPIHILGYYVDVNSEKLKPVLDWVVHDRDERNRKIAEKMAADGIPISYDRMRQRFGEVIGRPHFARILVELGLARNTRDAFDRYVEKGQRYYLPRNFLSIERSVEIIREAGGIPVLAHPFQYKRDDDGLRDILKHCMDYGLMGMECRYSGYSQEQSSYLEALADEYGLLMTGGSDFHGINKPDIRLGDGKGGLNVPYEFLERMKAVADGENLP